MGRRRFLVLLRGLSADSVWRHRLANAPKVLTGDAAMALINRM